METSTKMKKFELILVEKYIVHVLKFSKDATMYIIYYKINTKTIKTQFFYTSKKFLNVFVVRFKQE